MHTKSKHPNLLQFDTWVQFINLVHFSTTLQGGVSGGNYSSFNLGRNSGDDALNIDVNYRFLARMLGIEFCNLFTADQVHGDSICLIDKSFMKEETTEQQKRLKGIDAIITNIKNIGIGVTTADCVPILLYDPNNHVLAAVHAGWRGTSKRIVSKVVKKMISSFGTKAGDVIVGIGPSISAERFEVGEEVGDTFLKAGFDLKLIGYRNEQSGRLHINLQEANIIDLLEHGVNRNNIENAKLCTFANPDLFFSARRQTIKSGRMMTGGVLI